MQNAEPNTYLLLAAQHIEFGHLDRHQAEIRDHDFTALRCLIQSHDVRHLSQFEAVLTGVPVPLSFRRFQP